MTQIIKNRQAVNDEYTLVQLAEGDTPETVAPWLALPSPLAVWNARKANCSPVARRSVYGSMSPKAGSDCQRSRRLLRHRRELSEIHRRPAASTGRLLRERFGYQGEIRAIGDVLHDQLFLMARCGFDAFALKGGQGYRRRLPPSRRSRHRTRPPLTRPNPLPPPRL